MVDMMEITFMEVLTGIADVLCSYSGRASSSSSSSLLLPLLFTDDCWSETLQNLKGQLAHDPKTFPSGIKGCMMRYRYFHTAKIYGFEPAFGIALREAIFDGIVEREDIFVTSKLWRSDHNDPVSALKQSLQKL